MLYFSYYALYAGSILLKNLIGEIWWLLSEIFYLFLIPVISFIGRDCVLPYSLFENYTALVLTVMSKNCVSSKLHLFYHETNYLDWVMGNGGEPYLVTCFVLLVQQEIIHFCSVRMLKIFCAFFNLVVRFIVSKWFMFFAGALQS